MRNKSKSNGHNIDHNRGEIMAVLNSIIGIIIGVIWTSLAIVCLLGFCLIGHGIWGCGLCVPWGFFVSVIGRAKRAHIRVVDQRAELQTYGILTF